MREIDIAICSYKKPESLLYTLMSIKKYSGRHVNSVWINDDQGAPLSELAEIYSAAHVINYFIPWQLKTRRNTQRIGWHHSNVLGFTPRYHDLKSTLYHSILPLVKNHRLFTDKPNIRYQWAIDNTKQRYLFLVHDDILFFDDILTLYLQKMRENSELAMVGDLGQCWRCSHHDVCCPEKINNHVYPSPNWPITGPKGSKDTRRSCRMNEWCLLLDVEKIRDVQNRKHCLFGNYDDYGDVGAFFFDAAINCGYEVADPLPTQKQRIKYYQHGWFNQSGHSVWVDQGRGKTIYDEQKIKERTLRDFGLALI